MAAPSTQEAGKRQLQESGVRILTGMGVAEVKDGGVVVFRDGEVSYPIRDCGFYVAFSGLILWPKLNFVQYLLLALKVNDIGQSRSPNSILYPHDIPQVGLWNVT